MNEYRTIKAAADGIKTGAKIMIIDLILDRKNGEHYNAREFYFNVLSYGAPGYNITRAMDGGTENDVKKAICRYIMDGGYNWDLCYYVHSVNWL